MLPVARDFFNRIQKILGFRIIRIDEKKRVKWNYPESPGIVHKRALTGASYSPWLSESSFQNLFQALKGFTLVDTYRLWGLWSITGQMETVPGDVLEVGVWRGGVAH